MNKINLALLALILGSTVSVAGECVPPESPTVPGGAEATMEQMLAGQKSVKTFQEANIAYMACLEPKITAAQGEVESGSEDASAAVKKLEERYNEAVSVEEEVAGQFNTEIRAYKTANPK
jgi:hypothetical protein